MTIALEAIGTVATNHAANVNAVTAFQVGETYACRSICDYDCIYRFGILKRTAKSVWINVHGNTVRRAVRIFDGVEAIDPHGRYSMSPVLTADKQF
ncbi:MAG: hypothetical protein HOO99_03240 [Hyphomicrobiaceae bacterium]|nr:hypothetical protein [Hyphomicrobiaceae bacterium]